MVVVPPYFVVLNKNTTLIKDNGFPITDTSSNSVPPNSSKVVNHSTFSQGFQPVTLLSKQKTLNDSCPFHSSNIKLLMQKTTPVLVKGRVWSWFHPNFAILKVNCLKMKITVPRLWILTVHHNSSKVVNHSFFLQGFQPTTLLSNKKLSK
ncbi:hypothetical protein D0S48_14380 [Psychrobacillus sp. AK 1817]|nr:hypothetical protein D0S48_14380 [Psychrobacillus sp. AK 1817]